MKIVLWVVNESNQRALANKVHAVFPLSGIVTETRHSKRKLSAGIIAEKIFEKLLLSKIGKAWWNMKSYYEKKYPSFPATAMLDVENINSDEAYEFTKALEPDLILVSGTRLVKDKMLSIAPRIGILNLHTGLSPYVKGGPNCTNWCIATEQFHLIGNTIMWIDRGIDTGNILTTECTELNGTEDLNAIHLKVMEHAHDLYVRSVKYLAEGKSQNVIQSSIAKGRTYYTKEWTTRPKLNLVRNLRKLKAAIQSGKIGEERKKIIEVKLENIEQMNR